MDEALFMHFRKCLHYRHENVGSSRKRDPSAVLVEIILKAFSVNILHDEVSRVVLLEEILDRHDMGCVMELGKCPCLTKELIKALVIGLLL